MRVKAHGLADDVGGLCTAAGYQSHFIHGVKQLTVRRLEAVYLRDSPGDDSRHGVGHKIDLQRLGDGLLQHLCP